MRAHAAVTIAGLVLATGCGRLNFDPVSDGAADTADAALSAVAQRAYLKASNTGAGDTFGYSVALSADGSTLAVGARAEDSAATGVGGNEADNSALTAGAVYVFTRAGAAWSQQAYVKATTTNGNDRFGVTVTLSADGSTLAVGAYGDAVFGGSVYVYERTGATWTPKTHLTAQSPGANDEFGYSVSLSADGLTLAIGADLEDSAATGIDGNQADNTAMDAGAAFVFGRVAGTWTQQAYLKASNTGATDRFGIAVALSGDASTLVVGSFVEASAAIGVGGSEGDNSAPAAGAAYVYVRAGTTWTQQAYLKASNTGANDQFGVSVALSRDGSTCAVGAYGEASAATGIDGDQTSDAIADAGAVYLFARVGTSWAQQAYLKASNAGTLDRFGVAVAFSADGSTLAVAGDREASVATGIDGNQTDDSASGAGAVYLFTRSTAAWSQLAYIKASNTDAADGFGSSVAVSADASTLVIGAPDESSMVSGIDGNQADDTAMSAGAVYVFR